MADLLRILAVFALIILLLKLKWNLGSVMLIGAAALGLLMGMAPLGILRLAVHSALERSAVSLLAAFALIMVIENILRKTDTLKKLVESTKGLVGDQRVVMALMPAIVGILPSAGGAYFSAPMVDASAEGEISPERKSFINYWFRHVWEYISPLYPGFIMTAAIANVPMERVFRYQAVLPLSVIATGAVFAFKGVGAGTAPAGKKDRGNNVRTAFVSFIPILAVMVMVIVFRIDVAISMALVVAALFIFFRYSPGRIWETLKESLSIKTLLLVLGVEIFGGIMKGSGAVDQLPPFFQSVGVPVVVILFILPFIIGMITGITLAFVAITFPMLLPLIGGPHPDMGMLAFAFASGFAGLMFSPVHLCLVLTKDYFKSTLWPIYRIMLIPEAIVIGAAVIQMLLLGRRA